MSIGVLTKYFTRFNTTTMILYTYVYGVRPIIQQSDSQIVRRSVCCLHIYSYLELTGQVSIFSCFQPLLVLYLLVIVLSVLRFTLITPLVSLVCCVMFYRSVFAILSFGHCIVCPSVYADYPFGVMFYRALLVLYRLVIVLSVLRFTLITPLVSLVSCVMFYRSLFALLSFGYCIVCPSVYADYPFVIFSFLCNV